MNGKIVLGILAAILFFCALASIGSFAYNAGVAQGALSRVELAPAPAAPAPAPAPVAPSYPYDPYGRHWGFGWNIFGFLGPLFVFLILFAIFRRLLWGPRWGWGHRRYWGWGYGAPPAFDEWHRQAHQAGPSQTNPSGPAQGPQGPQAQDR